MWEWPSHALFSATLRYSRSVFSSWLFPHWLLVFPQLYLLKKPHQNRYPLGYSVAYERKSTQAEPSKEAKAGTSSETPISITAGQTAHVMIYSNSVFPNLLQYFYEYSKSICSQRNTYISLLPCARELFPDGTGCFVIQGWLRVAAAAGWPDRLQSGVPHSGSGSHSWGPGPRACSTSPFQNVDAPTSPY